MDGYLKKELKKLEHDYSYEDTVRFSNYNTRNHSENTKSEEFKRKNVRFTLYDKSSVIEEKKNSVISIFHRIRHTLRSKVFYLKMIMSDWIFLAILGFVVACISIFVDGLMNWFQKLQQEAVKIVSDASEKSWSEGWVYVSFAAWITYICGMIAASASFVHFVSPQAIGSGIPEMKTIIRGVILRDYLTLRTLVSKVFGVALALGSGVPIGKMGPFVHIASVVANQMSLLAARFDPAFGTETRRVECLAAACAVGVACTFSAPVGGVLFSIEVTTMYFSVRSYWRGFFAACCGATTIRLLKNVVTSWVAKSEVNVNAFFQTSFAPDAFTVQELPLFIILGVICGVLGAIYIALYRFVVLFLRNNKYAKIIFQRHWIVYPLFISFVFSICTFPHGLGTYTMGRLRFGMNLRDFFSNCTMVAPATSPLACGQEIVVHWLENKAHIILILTIYVCFHIVFSILCITLPVPSGIFMPVFVLGAAIGRLMGEIAVVTIPSGWFNGTIIYPGVYAVVGAASFSASVTHTVSVSVMIFEITGQLHYILPVMIAVLMSNAVCAYLQPSFFDTIIKIKHLPFLPDIPPTNSVVHTTLAHHMMTAPVMFITRLTSYSNIRTVLIDGRQLRIFPVVDSEASQILIGTISRRYLLELLEEQVGDRARRIEAERRVHMAIETLDEHFQNSQDTIRPRITRARSATKIAPEVRARKRTESEQSRVSSDADQLPRKESRFLVTPSDQSKIIPPLDNRRSSLGRRNAFCSLVQDSGVTLPRVAAHDMDEDHDKSNQSTGHLRANTLHGGHNYHSVVKSYLKHAKKFLHHVQFGQIKSEDQNISFYDLTPEERSEWEMDRLAEEIELTDEDIDPAPFQLVKKTSLFKIHTIFSMLQLTMSYVTDCGRLIGVVSLSDVRRALERTQLAREDDSTGAADTRPISPPTETLPRTASCGKILDILTPTLEVIRPTTFIGIDDRSLEADVERPISPAREVHLAGTASSLRIPPHRAGTDFTFFAGNKRGSISERSPEKAVEAFAYLRRKSLAAPGRRPTDYTKDSD